MNIEELVAEMNQMKQKIEEQSEEIEKLKLEKSNQTDMTNSINNLTTTHNTDVANLNARLDSLISNLDSTVSDTMMGKIHSISKSITFDSSTTKAYTGLSVTIPEESYYCLTGKVTWNYSAPSMVSINYNDTSPSAIAAENIVSEKDALISTTNCGKVDFETTFYLWAKYLGTGSNYGYFIGFYIN